VNRGVHFVVYGEPVPKGSKSAFPIHRKDGSIGVAVVEGKTDRQRQWTAAIREVAQRVAAERSEMLDGPLMLIVRFYLTRPKSEPKTRRTYPQRKPDLDKLIRGLDPLTGVLIVDDARICKIDASKDYADGRQPPRADIWIVPWEGIAEAEAAWGRP
jgi:Holliday junction resolvase RusA-like endonuclease